LFVLSLPVYGIKARNCSSLDKIWYSLVATTDCQNILETVVDNDSDDDNLNWLCSCNLQCNFDLIFLWRYFLEMCAFLISLYFFFLYNLSFSVTCSEPTILITFKYGICFVLVESSIIYKLE
jgi:hypothetical protein